MNKYDVQELDIQMQVFTEWLMMRIINIVPNKPREFKHTSNKYKTYDGGKTWHEKKKP